MCSSTGSSVVQANIVALIYIHPIYANCIEFMQGQCRNAGVQEPIYKKNVVSCKDILQIDIGTDESDKHPNMIYNACYMQIACLQLELNVRE